MKKYEYGEQKKDIEGNPTKEIFTREGFKNRSWLNLQKEKNKKYLLGLIKQKPIDKDPLWLINWPYRKRRAKYRPALAQPTSIRENWKQPAKRNK